jgi:hypothetical protein
MAVDVDVFVMVEMVEMVEVVEVVEFVETVEMGSGWRRGENGAGEGHG